METNRKITALFVVAALVIIGLIILYLVHSPTTQEQNSAQNSQPSAQTGAETIAATFACDGGKTIQATFVNATTATTTGNSVNIILSDGRQMSLPQVISADGARYANADQSFVFWNKGNGATVYENNQATYSNCTTQPNQAQ